MLIGTSLGKCMHSILSGRVDGDKVGLIITRTRAPTFDSFMTVVKEYFDYGNPGASSNNSYYLGEFNWDDVEQLAHNLWYGGRIHQPRNVDGWNEGYLMPEMRHSIWMEVVPTVESTNESVVAAYEQYQMLRALAE